MENLQNQEIQPTNQPTKKPGIPTFGGIVIIVATAIILFGGVFAYQYFFVKSQPITQIKDQLDQTAGWKTYTSSKYGFEIKYPNFIEVKEGFCATMCANEDEVGFLDKTNTYLKIETVAAQVKLWDSGKAVNSMTLDEFVKGFWEATKNDKNGLIPALLGEIKEISIGKQKAYIFSSENGIVLPSRVEALEAKTNFLFFSNADGSKGIISFKDENSKVVNQMLSTSKFTTSSQTVGWKTYDFVGYWGDKCSVKYPDTWELKQGAFEGDYFNYLAPKIKNIPEDIWVTLNCFPKGKNYTDQTGKDLTSFCKKGSLAFSQTQKFEGINTKEFCTQSDDGTQIGTMQFQVRYGRQQMDYYIPDADVSAELSVFKQMLPTFKFTTSSQTIGWKTYTDTKYGFEFKYPEKNFTNTKKVSGDCEVNDISYFNGNGDPVRLPNIKLGFQGLYAVVFCAKITPSIIDNYMSQYFGEKSSIGFENVRIGGKEAYKTNFVIATGYEHRVALIPLDENHFLELNHSYGNSDFLRGVPQLEVSDWEKMLSSFKFTK